MRKRPTLRDLRMGVYRQVGEGRGRGGGREGRGGDQAGFWGLALSLALAQWPLLSQCVRRTLAGQLNSGAGFAALLALVAPRLKTVLATGTGCMGSGSNLLP